MSLTGRWINLVYRVATGNWKIKLLIAPIVALLFFGMIFLFIAFSMFADHIFGFYKIVSYYSLVAGIVLFASGFIIMIVSITHFLKVRGTPVPFCPPPKLVNYGLYKYARNPMLSGIFLQLFGLGIFLGSISLTLIFTPLFILINVIELIKIEEPELEKRLGKEYAEYKKNVPMFFPWKKIR